MHESSDYVGIYKVKVYTPLYLKNPILLFRNEKGIVTYPLGNWIGTYTSSEITNAEKYRYKFDILNGYLFTAVDLFSNYIEVFNKIKETSSKNSPMYL